MIRAMVFVLRVVMASLRSERLNHALTLTTVAVSMALVGAVYLAQVNLVAWAERWASERGVAVFVDPAADEVARKRIDNVLRRELKLERVTWQAPDATAADLAKLLGLKGTDGLDAFAPWVAEARLSTGASVTAVAALATDPAVLHVDTGAIVAARVERIARGVALGGSLVALLLLLGAYLVLANTVGLALNARRDEVEIMELVGTPLGWIYAAYMSEGVLLGGLGAGLAVGLLEAARTAVGDALSTALSVPPLIGFGTRAWGFIAVGAVIGAVGSATSIRRFLKRSEV